MSEFALEIDQDKFLRPDKTEVHAVLSLTGSGAGRPAAGAGAPDFAEVILIDCSSSMEYPSSKIAAALSATRAAIDALADGALFAVVKGTGSAEMVHPRHTGLVRADAGTRRQALRALTHVQSGGSTAIGRWLDLARELHRTHDRPIRHATLLTDGQKTDHQHTFEQTLERCRGAFQCDARGIGDDWNSREVLHIAEALRGRGDAVREEHELADDFRAIIAAAMGRRLAQLRIRLTLSGFAEFRYLKQVFPIEADLSAHVHRVDERTIEIDTGAWGDESRDYQLCLTVGTAGEPNENVRAARIDLVAGDDPLVTPGLILLHRISDPFGSEQLSSRFEHYREQLELSQAVGDGCDLYQVGNHAAALTAWQRAVDLAQASGNQEILHRLRQVVEADPGTGRLRLRPGVRRRDLLWLDTGSVVLERSRQAPAGPAVVPGPRQPVVAGPDQVCPCGRISPWAANFCEHCKQPLKRVGTA